MVVFLRVACTDAYPMLVAGPLLAAVAALIGLRHCESALFAPLPAAPGRAIVLAHHAHARGRLLFGAWSVLTMALAATAYFRTA